MKHLVAAPLHSTFAPCRGFNVSALLHLDLLTFQVLKSVSDTVS